MFSDDRPNTYIRLLLGHVLTMAAGADPAFPISLVIRRCILLVPTTLRSYPALTSYTVSFFLEHPTTAVIVLSQLDDRYFRMISGRFWWSFDFLLYKKGVKVSLASSSYSRFFSRSVSLEIELEAGDYVVHVRSTYNQSFFSLQTFNIAQTRSYSPTRKGTELYCEC